MACKPAQWACIAFQENTSDCRPEREIRGPIVTHDPRDTLRVPVLFWCDAKYMPAPRSKFSVTMYGCSSSSGTTRSPRGTLTRISAQTRQSLGSHRREVASRVLGANTFAETENCSKRCQRAPTGHHRATRQPPRRGLPPNCAGGAGVIRGGRKGLMVAKDDRWHGPTNPARAAHFAHHVPVFIPISSKRRRDAVKPRWTQPVPEARLSCPCGTRRIQRYRTAPTYQRRRS